MSEPRNGIAIAVAALFDVLSDIIAGDIYETSLGTNLVIGEPNPVLDPMEGMYISAQSGTFEVDEYDNCEMVVSVEITALQSIRSQESSDHKSWAAVGDIRKALVQYIPDAPIISVDARSFATPRRTEQSAYVISTIQVDVRVADLLEYRV